MNELTFTPETRTTSSRVPPQNIDAEKSVIGSILLDPEAIHAVMPILYPEDFYHTGNQTIYRAMLILAEQNQPIDLLTLTERLQSEDQLDKIGGAAYLSELVDRIPTSANVVNYAKIVREKSTLREVIQRGTSIVNEAYGGEGEQVDEFLDRVEKVIFEISEKRASAALMPISDVVHEGMAAIEKMYGTSNMISGTASGFHELDRMLSGLQPSDLIIIAGRPSMGKTAFALNVTQNVALRAKVPVAIFSLEMSRSQLAMRMLCSEGRIDSAKLRTGNLTETDWLRLTKAAG